jgi:hypothetical protein
MSELDYGICKKCNQPNTGDEWCRSCNAKRVQENFKNWTSGNDDIDKFIQHTQLSATNSGEVLEWIPYDRFYDIKFIAKGGFGNVYKANWIDGRIFYWDNENNNWVKKFKNMLWNNKNSNWKRYKKNQIVALKSLNNSKNVRLEFINEV